MAEDVFRDRTEAGQLLGDALQHHERLENGLVLALPRGGVPVASEVARKLQLPLDLMLVRKLGFPGQEELAMGAIASGGTIVLNERLVDQFSIGDDSIDLVASKERRELARRETAYRGDRPQPQVDGRTIILVDDGLATGSTMRAAIEALRRSRPGWIVAAVPVAPPDTVRAIGKEADEVVCLRAPEPFQGVGRWYRNFAQTTDEEVRNLLASAWGRQTESTY